ncbi:hypothetical protein GGI25_003762 [Coemansia spiralis]|uniref:WH2 domain-containing protein n=2 Tax=Coemansia TaxID=4863 RepID=A0A9W8KW61_9FUNG|nr:hypothetical protein BX070DRAFT_219373 [Coemansia spiralis]KAJ1994363.1 hypothetical protein EDC05_001562 [Coemansia umbellata]KAJ2624328.1 hypothetical protein GGI26_001684 [Coemansia sp. RSA 1358]KAJ2675925.1 hypothetical protein GGI25_003762 [Coemansia spiralis]
MADRNALLKQIQQGKRLKKAQTDDRSAPTVSGSGGGSRPGGGIPPGGGMMGLPRPPMPPTGGIPNSGSGGGAGGGNASAEPRGPPPGIPGLGGLFAGGIPKLKHRTGGVNIGRTSEDKDTAPSITPTVPQPSPQSSTAQKSSVGSRFSLPFRRNSHGRSSSQSDTASVDNQHKAMAPVPPVTKAPPPPPRMQGLSGAPSVPVRRPSDADSTSIAASVPAGRLPPPPPASAPPSRPASSISGKKAPPPRPTSRKPQIMPKPANLSNNRVSSLQSSPTPGVGSVSDLRGQLKTVASGLQGSSIHSAPINGRSSTDDDNNGESGIIQESQGSVSSLAGMFGQSIRSKTPGQNRALSGNTFAGAAPPPPVSAKAPPLPPQHSLANASSNGSFAHRRTGSGIAAPIQPPPPPPPSSSLSQYSGSRPNGAGSLQDVPVREGKWTFHSLSDIPPPPTMNNTQHIYPSGNRTGNSIGFNI